MAKQLGSKPAPEGASANEGDTNLNDETKNDGAEGAEGADGEGGEGGEGEQTKAVQADAPKASKPADGFLAAKDVKVGGKYKFYNTQVYTTRCPYSNVTFPAGNFTPEEVEVNQWIKSQVDSDLIRAKK